MNGAALRAQSTGITWSTVPCEIKNFRCLLFFEAKSSAKIFSFK